MIIHDRKIDMLTWITEPTVFFGLLTLVILEIVLSIDNIIFISILANKLPENKRQQARSIGLLAALLIRLAMLTSITWLVSLTQPFIDIFDKSFSIRDIILILGGAFLIFKATIELHERIENSKEHKNKSSNSKSSFLKIVTQIIIIDAVFSIDSIITAVGMTNHLDVMIIAVIVSVIIMIFSSKWISDFLNSHQTFIVLCLGFLIMIGCSLILDGCSFHIPKGYLYTSIAFSLSVEIINQIIRTRKGKD